MMTSPSEIDRECVAQLECAVATLRGKCSEAQAVKEAHDD